MKLVLTVTLCFLALASFAVAFNFPMSSWTLDSVRENSYTSKCTLLVQQNVVDTITVPGCSNEVTITLNNEYRGGCKSDSVRCPSVHHAYDSPIFMENTYIHACFPVPAADNTHVVVRHQNYQVNQGGCVKTVDFSYVNATSCSCLLMYASQ